MTRLAVVDTDIADMNFTICDGELLIGRATDNHIKYTDKTLSKHHARIYTYLDASYIEDLDSTNGTYVNGRRVKKHTLHKGDELKLGRHKFRIVGQI